MKPISELYNRYYKGLLILPCFLLFFSVFYLANTYTKTGEFFEKDVSLTGGTTVTFFTNLSLSEIKPLLSEKFPDISVVSLSDNTGQQTAIVVTSAESPEKLVPILETISKQNLTDENSSIEFSGSNLSKDFYTQLIRALIFAFLLMALVVFLVFGNSSKDKVICSILTIIVAKLTFPLSSFLGALAIIVAGSLLVYGFYIAREKTCIIYLLLSFSLFLFSFFFPIYWLVLPISLLLVVIYTITSVPSIAVISAAFLDILFTLVVIDILGIKLSSAGIVALLMLVGYSVDTDILLTTRVLRRKQESVNSSIFGAFKTGMTMTLTSIIAVAIALFIVYRFGTVLNQIFSIICIGLGFDILNTWVTNASLIKWFVEKK
jgi:preprotein translocase subunit SecF